MNLLIALTESELSKHINELTKFCYRVDIYGTGYSSKVLGKRPSIRVYVLSEEPKSFDMIELLLSKECCTPAQYSYYERENIPALHDETTMQTLMEIEGAVMLTSTNSLSDVNCKKALEYYAPLNAVILNLDEQNLDYLYERITKEQESEVNLFGA